MTEPAPRKATWRLGTRERMRLQTGVIVLICVLLAIALRPHLLGLIQTRDFVTCQTNVLKIGRAVQMYMQEWDDTLPVAGAWMDATEGNLAPTSGTGFEVATYFHCPRDRRESPSSYAYNELLAGLSLTARQKDAAHEARRARIGRLDRAPLIVERHGSERNAHLPLPDWDAVRRAMTFPHYVPEPTGTMVLASGRPWYRSRSDIPTESGPGF